ncbi:putative Glycine zipper domain-containing protein [Azospirillaceae bacterium]
MPIGTAGGEAQKRRVTMMKVVFSVALGLMMLCSAPVLAAGGDEGPTTISSQIVLAAGAEAGLPVGEILRLEPVHLLALGTGVLVGAVVVGPYLGISELIGVAIGVIASELTYRSGMWPFQKSNNWLL